MGRERGDNWISCAAKKKKKKKRERERRGSIRLALPLA